LRIGLEAGGATALAELVSGAYQPQYNEMVGAVGCGGNVDVRAGQVLARGPRLPHVGIAAERSHVRLGIRARPTGFRRAHAINIRIAEGA